MQTDAHGRVVCECGVLNDSSPHALARHRFSMFFIEPVSSLISRFAALKHVEYVHGRDKELHNSAGSLKSDAVDIASLSSQITQVSSSLSWLIIFVTFCRLQNNCNRLRATKVDAN